MKIGDTILIPKGTMVFDFMSGDRNPKISKRASKASIESFMKMGWHDFLDYRRTHEFMHDFAYNPIYAKERSVFQGGIGSQNMHLFPTLLIQEEKKRIAEMLEDDYDLVMWGSKMARKADVQVIDKPVAKERKVTKKTMMVKGSRWRFTKTTTITAMVQAERDLRLQKEAAEIKARGLPYDRHNPYRDMFTMPIFTVPEGTEFVVTSTKHRAINWQPEMGVPVDINESEIEYHITHTRPDGSSGGRGVHPSEYWGQNPFWANEFTLPYKQIEDYVEPIDIPDTFSYLLKDRDTGKYFAGFDVDWNTRDSQVKMSDTFTSAKKYATIANAKSSIMDWTGMQKGNFSDQTDWAGGDKKMDLPSSWVVVKVDVLSKREAEEIDIQEWYKEKTNA